ncbi:DUF4910 domain-containing protein [Candidatus Nitrospira bockiana]
MNDPGKEMYGLIAELYPLCRSITGNGVRETLRRIRNDVPLEIHEVPTGTPVFDWVVPKEWNIRDAYVKNARGERVIDFRRSNLHALGYSVPVRARLSLNELRGHLFSLPEFPDWVPYRTSYYKENWGFCLSHRQLLAMEEGEYEVCIDATLEDGSLTYGEYYLQGDTEDEVLLSCHICHPSLCNDNLSGLALAAMLAKSLSTAPRRYSYRFLFVPGTIGSITWLARNEPQVSKIRHGLVVACVGDAGKFTYKKSRRGDAEIDRVVQHVLKHSGHDYEVVDFYPFGYDERQYCSPGFNLPVGALSRSTHGRYPQYHTSADDLDLVEPRCLAESLTVYRSVVELLERNRTYVNRFAKCEPQLGRRGLYRSVAGQADGRSVEMALLWALNLSDGAHSLLAMAERSGLDFRTVDHAVQMLVRHELLKAHDFELIPG